MVLLMLKVYKDFKWNKKSVINLTKNSETMVGEKLHFLNLFSNS